MTAFITKITGILRPVINHWLGLIGILILAIASCMLPIMTFVSLFEMINNYLETVVWVIIWLLFFTGIILSITGYFLHKKYPDRWFLRWILDLGNPEHRIILVIIVFFLGMGIIIFSLVSTTAIHHSESNSFCSNTCHSVMKPEAVSHKNSPHSRVKCVKCHIKTGTVSFLKAKLSGIRRVAAVILNNYRRPIADLKHELHPARDTCENCHWPLKFHGDKLQLEIDYQSEDEYSKPLYSARLLKIGGRRSVDVKNKGIHWHVGNDISIQYKTLPGKEKEIGWVKSISGSQEKVFASKKFKALPDRKNLTMVKMSCVDCHNRVAHIFLSAEQSINNAISSGLIDRSLPWIKREGIKILEGKYKNDRAKIEIPKMLLNFYNMKYSEKVKEWRNKIKKSSAALVEIYQDNIFPEMNITWNTYVDNSGHSTGGGCFRCHNGDLMGPGGDDDTISSDCNLCHIVIGDGVKDPALILKYIQGFTVNE